MVTIDGNFAVDKEEVVHSEGFVEVGVAAAAVDLEEVVDVEGNVMRRYLPKILMLIWTSIIQKHQRQCRQIEGISCVNCLELHLSSMTNLCLMSNDVKYFCLSFYENPCLENEGNASRESYYISVCGVWAIVVYCSFYFGLKFGLMDSCENVFYTHTIVSFVNLF